MSEQLKPYRKILPNSPDGVWVLESGDDPVIRDKETSVILAVRHRLSKGEWKEVVNQIVADHNSHAALVAALKESEGNAAFSTPIARTTR